MLFGLHEHSLDSKNRLAIPSAVRDVLRPDVHGERFIAAPGLNGCLWLWPEKTFERWAASQGQTLSNPEEVARFEFLLFSQASSLSLDRVGRVCLPERLVTRYGLSGTLAIAGVRDHLEVRTKAEMDELMSSLEPAFLDSWRKARQALDERSAPGK